MTTKLLEDSYELIVIITSPPTLLLRLLPQTPPRLFPIRVANDLCVKCNGQVLVLTSLAILYHVTQLVTHPSLLKHFLTRCLSRSISSRSAPWARDNGGPKLWSSLLSSIHALWTNANSCG